MKNLVLLLLLVIVVAIYFACMRKKTVNPFLMEFDTPFGTPPFDKIKKEHYLPAIKEGIAQHKLEISAIAQSKEAPNFANTIEALDKSGQLISRVNKVLEGMNAAMTDDTLQKIAQEVAPLLSVHSDEILLNDTLFNRIKVLYDKRETIDLQKEQQRLLEKFYKDFVRGGAELADDKKAQLKKINKELSVLQLKFIDNVLEENNGFELVIENKKDLEGLPDDVVATAAQIAKDKGYADKWVFTLQKPSLIPFLTYAKNRSLREKIYKGYINRGNNNNDFDNKELCVKMANLRIEKAKILGYETFAHYTLEEQMAKTPEKVYALLNKLWKPAIAKAKEDAQIFQSMIKEEGESFALASWDWWYYAEKLKKREYDLDEAMLRPYFKLENVIEGAFTVVNKLYGISFTERNDIPVYHKDCKVFEVKNADGSHVGVFYIDYYVRDSKNGGAWMDSFRKQSKDHSPIIHNVCNFAKPTDEQPSLLSLEQVTTLYHELGHALHGLLSNCTYESLSGTDVPRDFVELPSQILENWATEPTVLELYAKHYKTGEAIPQELIEKIKKSNRFNQGFAATEYLAASLLDMDWHTITETEDRDPIAFENQSFGQMGLIPEIIARYRSPYFAHIFSYGYSAGYYSYIWAEVLDADAFSLFQEKGIFNTATAQSFRDNILAKGGTEDPMELYVSFRGSEPKIDALLKRKGFNE